MQCWIYRSSKKDEMYLYLRERDAFDLVPAALRTRFGTPVFVMDLTLTPERPLAREDVAMVIASLREQGFHLQMPPRLEPALYHGNDL